MASPDKRPSRAKTSPFIPALVLVVLVVGAIGAYYWISGEDFESANNFPEQLEDETQRPTGAGTLPDGLADARQEGVVNRVEGEEILDSSNATNLTPPMIDTEANEPPLTGEDEAEIVEQMEQSRENLERIDEETTGGTVLVE